MGCCLWAPASLTFRVWGFGFPLLLTGFEGVGWGGGVAGLRGGEVSGALSG